MMRWIVTTSLRFRFLAVFLPIVMLVFGGLQLRDAPVDVFPEFAPPQVEVQTAALGLSPSEVEELVTVPLEDALNGVAGLDVIRSKSVPDLSSIRMIFQEGTDVIAARQLVQERLAVVVPNLPRWASPPVILQPLSATSRAMKIGLTSDEHSLIDLSMTSYWRIRQRLMRVPGVANVAIWGQRKEMLQVHVDPKELGDNGVSLDQLMQVTADALDSGLLQYSDGAMIGTGGFIESPNQRLGVRSVLPIVEPEDLAAIPIAERDGEVLRLGDLANVLVDHQLLVGDAVINDGPGIMLIVEKFPWGNFDDNGNFEKVMVHGWFTERMYNETTGKSIEAGTNGYNFTESADAPGAWIHHGLMYHATIPGVGRVLVDAGYFVMQDPWLYDDWHDSITWQKGNHQNIDGDYDKFCAALR